MTPKQTWQLAGIALLAAVLLTMSVPMVDAQSGGAYTLTWNTIDGGGGTSTGGAYTVSGTLGQPDAATVSGGAYTLAGGFWSGLQNLVSYSQHLFLPFLQKSP